MFIGESSGNAFNVKLTLYPTEVSGIISDVSAIMAHPFMDDSLTLSCNQIDNAMAKYSDRDKVEVLKVLEMNGFNFALTAKITGVSRTTLIKWKEKMGSYVFAKHRLPEVKQEEPKKDKAYIEGIAKDIEEKHVEEEKNFLTKAYNLRDQLLEKISVMIPGERNMYNVVKAVQAVDEIVTNREEQEDSSEGMNFMEQLTLKLTANGKNNSTAGDRQELPS
jgi:hypothetical protein